jgi:transcriptional regulator with GAF, ATPase, and Fis domain
MFGLPTRTSLAELTRAAGAVVPVAALGFVRPIDDHRVSVVYSYPHGIGEYVLPGSEVPEPLRSSTAGLHQSDAAQLVSKPQGAMEWFLRSGGVERLVSIVTPADPATRLWIGTPDRSPLSEDQMQQLHVVAGSRAAAIQEGVSAEEEAERARRLEVAAELLPAFLHVLDVRDIFGHLSAAARRALAHDLLLLRLFNEDLSTITVFARSDGRPELGPVVPHGYPPAVIRAWAFSIVDDLTTHPVEADAPPTKLGARSALRIPVKFDDRVIGGLLFLSREVAAFTSADVPVGRRLADYVAVALSHQRLAEEGRRTAALRERAASLEMLDGLLATLTGVLDIREVFDRVSAIAQKVLPHDALSIAEAIDEGARVRIHASHGLGDLPEPFDIPMPDPTLMSESWDFRLIDDARELPEYSQGPGVAAGMRSMMFVPIRLEGRHYGGLNFYSKTPGRYVKDDVLVARRITDHVALALSHRRLAEQARRHEELRARTTNLELLDELLAALTGAGDLPDVFGRVSTIAHKVLRHDAAALMVRLPDGRRARVHASSGFREPLPAVTEIPEELLQNPEWDHDILDDLASQGGTNYERLARMGFASLLRVPVRLDGRFAGALLFLSAERSAFRHADILVAHRIADRLALALARDRELAESRRADEATARAARLEARVRALTDELDSRSGYRRAVGESRQWRQVLTEATQVAPTDTTVLLLGESGTGKEVVARFLHRASARNAGPFVALNCAALPEQLLEAELFGYERGAYTGAVQTKPGQLEQAAGGTLFLDEVGEMSLSAQAKFLRVLQEREFQRLGGTRVLRTDARVVAATNRDLQRAIGNGAFREDLYYRLNVFAIRLPPLRDRRDDILPLSEAFLSEIGRGFGRPPAGISRDARQRLVEYHWPGNVRELRNILERAAILCDGGLITAGHLALNPVPATMSSEPPSVATAPQGAAAVAAPLRPAPPSSAGDLKTLERTMIEEALQNARFNKSKAAKALGLTRHQLYIRMRKYGLD